MKIFLVLCLLATAVLASDFQDRWNRVHRHCQEKPHIHVHEQIFIQIKYGQRPYLPANFGSHVVCMLIRLNLLDESRQVVAEEVKVAVQRHYTDPSKVEEVVKACTSVSGSGQEAIALGLFVCLSKNGVNIGQL